MIRTVGNTHPAKARITKRPPDSAPPVSPSAARARTRLLLVACVLALTLTAHLARAQAPGEPVMVDDVLIVGLKSIPTQTVKAQLKTRPGQPYNVDWVKEDLDRLGKMNSFKPPRVDVQPVAGSSAVKVTYIVEEYPSVIQDIQYKHAHHAKQEELEGLTNLKRGLPLSPSTNRQACQLIVDFYKHEQGRYFASCVLEEGGNPGDTRVVFNITEGPVVRIRYISFTGNDTLASSQRLYSQIDTWKRFLCFQMITSKFDPQRIDSDAAKLETYYQTNGYLTARVTRELIFTDDHQYVDVVFHITEGLRYHIKDVAVEGTAVLPREQVQSILRVRQGEIYDDRVIESDVKNIQDLYGWRGYPAVVTKKLVYLDPASEPGLVRVKYQIDERKPFKVKQIIPVGNDITKFRVIYHFLDIYPGQTLAYPALKEAEHNLARSGLFDQEDRPTVTVVENEDSFDSEYKDILVKVKETMTGSLMFGASVNSDAGLVGSIVLNERNFDILRPPTSLDDILDGRAWRGAGQELRIEAMPGTEVQRYSATFREPYLFDLPYSLSTSGYYFQRQYPEDLEARTGMNVAVSHLLNRNWSVSLGLRLENVNISDVPYYAPIDYLSVIGNNLVVAPRVSVSYDNRDSYLRPTEGQRFQFTYEQLLGDFSAPILTLEGSQYFCIHQRPDGSGKQVLMFRSQLGWAGNDTPVFERFYAGGTNSLRGFEFRGVGPITDTAFNNGGDFMWLNSVEYQIPVLANDMIYFVAFVDSGTVEPTIGIENYRVSAGVGARITVPQMGQVPIALDFGFPIVRATNDRTQMFSFAVGYYH
jgi:outer membrane protein insertion porin family